MIIIQIIHFVGWHNGFAQTAGKKVPLYDLIEDLHKEAAWTNVTVTLVSEGRLSRHQRKKYTNRYKVDCLCCGMNFVMVREILVDCCVHVGGCMGIWT